MKIIDISWPISAATTGYKDKKTIAFHEVKSFVKDDVRETEITLSSHSGTHVDAPSHFFRDGKTIDQLDLHRLIGNAVILDLRHVAEEIVREDLQAVGDRFGSDDIVLLKTTNSFTQAVDHFTPHFIYLHASGAAYLAEKKVKAVGIDYLGIERNQPGHLTHKTLIEHDIAIIEGLRLEHAQAKRYEFYCLPLYTIGLEAAPARAVLIER